MVLNELHDPVRPKPKPKPPINWSDKLNSAKKFSDIFSNAMRAGSAIYNTWQLAQMANRMGELGGFARPIPWVRPVPAIEL
jgi:hypothetical protein